MAVPYDTALRGWRMGAGPERLLAAGLLERLGAAGHRTRAELLESRGAPAEIGTAFDLMRQVAARVRAARAAGRLALVLSGNCNTAMGTLAGLSPARRAILWFDAHGDFNTPETTRSGFLDGMALATATGRCWRELAATVPGFLPVAETNVVLVGARDLDPAEAALLRRATIPVVGSADLAASLAAQLARLGPAVDLAYVHCDLDVFDPAVGQANPFPVGGGLALEPLLGALRSIGEAMPIGAAAITAYAPESDRDGRVAEAALRVAETLASAAHERR